MPYISIHNVTGDNCDESIYHLHLVPPAVPGGTHTATIDFTDIDSALSGKVSSAQWSLDGAALPSPSVFVFTDANEEYILKLVRDNNPDHSDIASYKYSVVNTFAPEWAAQEGVIQARLTYKTCSNLVAFIRQSCAGGTYSAVTMNRPAAVVGTISYAGITYTVDGVEHSNTFAPSVNGTDGCSAASKRRLCIRTRPGQVVPTTQSIPADQYFVLLSNVNSSVVFAVVSTTWITEVDTYTVVPEVTTKSVIEASTSCSDTPCAESTWGSGLVSYTGGVSPGMLATWGLSSQGWNGLSCEPIVEVGVASTSADVTEDSNMGMEHSDALCMEFDLTLTYSFGGEGGSGTLEAQFTRTLGDPATKVRVTGTPYASKVGANRACQPDVTDSIPCENWVSTSGCPPGTPASRPASTVTIPYPGGSKFAFYVYGYAQVWSTKGPGDAGGPASCQLCNEGPTGFKSGGVNTYFTIQKMIRLELDT